MKSEKGIKLIIAGSRTLTPDFGFMKYALRLAATEMGMISEVVSGMAEGVDREGEHLAGHMNIPIAYFPADWDKYGKRSGPLRNQEMGHYADALLLIWDGESKGSAKMRYIMKSLDKPVFEIIIKKA